MHMSPRYGKNGKVLRLNKVLYGLWRSLLLWQQKLTNELKKLSFQKISQKPCVVQKNGIIGFFYVDNIVFTYKKDQKNKVDRVVELL